MVLNVTGKATKAIYKICSKLTKKAPEGTYEQEAAVRRCFSKKVFSKFRKFHRKTPVLEFLFTKVVGKRDSNTGAFLGNFARFLIR